MPDAQTRKTFSRFIAEAFSEPDGNASSSRIMSAFVIVFICGWISAAVAWIGFIAFHTKTVPDTSSLSSLVDSFAMFACSVTGSTYGINKVSTLFGKNGARPDDCRPEDRR